MYRKWPDKIFPMVNSVVSCDGHFGLGGGGSLGGAPPPLNAGMKMKAKPCMRYEEGLPHANDTTRTAGLSPSAKRPPEPQTTRCFRHRTTVNTLRTMSTERRRTKRNAPPLKLITSLHYLGPAPWNDPQAFRRLQASGGGGGGGRGGSGLGGGGGVESNREKLRENCGTVAENCVKIATLLNPQGATILNGWLGLFASVIQKVPCCGWPTKKEGNGVPHTSK